MLDTLERSSDAALSHGSGSLTAQTLFGQQPQLAAQTAPNRASFRGIERSYRRANLREENGKEGADRIRRSACEASALPLSYAP